MNMKIYKRCIALAGLLLICMMNLYAQGTLWGILSGGGQDNTGVIFNTNSDNTSNNSVVHNFKVDYAGANPQYGRLLLAPNGKFYGLTYSGGKNDFGVLFEYDPSLNTYKKEFDFDGTQGKYPSGSLTWFNGKLYGLASQGGSNNLGVLFQYDLASKAFTVVYNFTDGSAPLGDLTVANNKLYGMTNVGGSSNTGIIFSFDPSNNSFVKHKDLAVATGSWPSGSLTLFNSKLYGMTKSGGANSKGVLFELDITAVPHTYTVKNEFTGTTGTTPGSSPYGGLTVVNNKLYGMTYQGGTSDLGVFFEYDPSGAGTYSVLRHFNGANGSHPTGSLLLASNGKLYGTTYDGGSGIGVLFEYDIIGGLYAKTDFSGFGYSYGSLAEVNGNLYSMTHYLGVSNSGSLFQYAIATKTLTKKIDFNSSSDGRFPGTNAGLEMDANTGMLYGTVKLGGANDKGAIFQLDPTTFSYTKKYDFANGISGNAPSIGLTWVGGAVQKFFGVTSAGGASNVGAIFEFDPATNIYTKKVDLVSAQGASISEKLILASNGKLYGLATGSGPGNGTGANSWGSIIEYTPGANTYVDKYDFTNTPNGANGVSPSGSLVELNGILYGTTSAGGAGSAGVIFGYNLISGYSKVYDFSAATGRWPIGGLTSSNNKLYGTCSNGGAYTYGGVIFEYDPALNTYIDLHDFNNATGENASYAGLTVANGKLYGMTKFGGVAGGGVLFEYNIGTSTYTKKFDFTGLNGASPYAQSLLYIPGKLSQGIAFDPLGSKNYGDAPFALNAVGGASGNPVTYISSNTAVATITGGNTVNIVGAGSTNIKASQAGNATYSNSPDVVQSLLVKQLPTSVNTTGTLNDFTTTLGTPSSFQSFIASGDNLTANLVVTAPADFEVSLSSGNGYASSVNIAPISGTVGNTTIYVRYNPSVSGNHSGNVALTSIGATDKLIPVNGNALVLVNSISVNGTGNVTTISGNAGTLQINVAVLPNNASNQNVTWSISSGSAYATLNASGLLTAVANGTVTVKATANDASGVFGTKDITITGQTILVSSVTVSGAGNATTISSNAGTLQMNATIVPNNASNQNVTWSISSGSAYATINASGLLTAVANGTVTVKATANDASGVFGTKDITITGQTILVTSVTVSGAGNATTISSNAGTLQMNASVLPNNASNKNVTWSISSASAYATINASGLLTAVANGTVTVKATANDASGIFGTKDITITGQTILVTNVINVSGTLQFGENTIGIDHTSKSFTIANSGTGILTVTGIDLPADLTADKTTGTVTVGQNMVVNLTFTPTQAKDYSGSITVISNATSGNASLAFTGKGVLIAALEEQQTENGIRIYPNPSKGVFTMRVTDADENVVIIDVNGKSSNVKMVPVEKNFYKLDLSDRTDGTYLLKYKSGKINGTVRLVKKQ
jgi:uncharacterized repeat protein (TIGR03803 family)